MPLLLVALVPTLFAVVLMLLDVGEAGREWGALAGSLNAGLKLAMVYCVFLLVVSIGLGALTTLLRWRGWHQARHYVLAAVTGVSLWVLANRLPLSAAQLPALALYTISIALLAGLCAGLYWWLRRPDQR